MIASPAMPEGDRDDQAGDTESFLRAIARAPKREIPSPLSGQVAQFRILSQLGKGGMGVVYRARDEALRRDVALKLLPLSMAHDEMRRERFLREARAAAAVTHPNIAAVYAVGVADGRHYIAMELVEGTTLRAHFAGGPLAIAEALRIGKAIGRGLSRAHERGIIHRDLKPDNVMIDRDGEPKILDFGLAKLFEPEEPSARPVDKTEPLPLPTESGVVLGTRGYMAPEQLLAGDVDARCDVFAFGVCLYEMLIGVRPFEARSAYELVVAIETPPSLRARRAEVPAELEAIVQRCLAKAPDDRYASAREVVEALERVGPPREEMKLPSRRRSYLAIAALVLAIGTGLAWKMRREPAAAAITPAPIAASANAGQAITDAPAPPSHDREASAAYASALRHVHDASRALAAEDFRRAATIDPALAAAHVRVVLYGGAWSTLAELREHYAAASHQRGALDPRDRLLLRLAESYVADAPTPDQIV